MSDRLSTVTLAAHARRGLIMHDIGKTTALNSYSASYENPSCVCAFVEDERGTDKPTHIYTYTHTHV